MKHKPSAKKRKSHSRLAAHEDEMNFIGLPNEKCWYVSVCFDNFEDRDIEERICQLAEEASLPLVRRVPFPPPMKSAVSAKPSAKKRKIASAKKGKVQVQRQKRRKNRIYQKAKDCGCIKEKVKFYNKFHTCL